MPPWMPFILTRCHTDPEILSILPNTTQQISGRVNSRSQFSIKYHTQNLTKLKNLLFVEVLRSCRGQSFPWGEILSLDTNRIGKDQGQEAAVITGFKSKLEPWSHGRDKNCLMCSWWCLCFIYHLRNTAFIYCWNWICILVDEFSIVRIWIWYNFLRSC